MFITMALTLVTGILLVVAQIVPNDLVLLLVPVIVWLATTTVNWLKSKVSNGGFGGTVVVTLLVPLISLAAAWLADMALNPGISFWMLFALGILGTYFNELIKQWTQTFKGEQTRASTNLTGKKKNEIYT